ncbi:MAG TPA: hypothetical protein VF072_16365 [Thermoleophilaceae bacterium]
MNRSAPTTSLAALALAGALLLGCGSDDGPPEQAGSTSASTASDGKITSSIREGAELADPVRWQAALKGVAAEDVSEVRFLIDGRVKHVEQLAPYEFAGSHNLLLPGTLGPGSHTFAVDARLVGGGRLTAASTAKVSGRAKPTPAAVVGRWTRTVAPAEIARTDGFRRAEYGEPLPAGRWTVEIGADGVARYTDPYRRSDSLTVGQVRFGPDGSLVVGYEIPNAGGEGYFCPDTVGVGRYDWSARGDTLVVDVVRDRECADRNSFWNGTFTRMEDQ